MDAASQHGQKSIDQLIINSPYEEPQEHWKYHRETRLFTREPERRKAGYIRASESSRSADDPGIFVPLPLVTRSGRESRNGAKRIIPAQLESQNAYSSTGATSSRAIQTGDFSFASSKRLRR